jgi:hypothetical protein
MKALSTVIFLLLLFGISYPTLIDKKAILKLLTDDKRGTVTNDSTFKNAVIYEREKHTERHYFLLRN